MLNVVDMQDYSSSYRLKNRLSEADFDKIADYIERTLGIKLEKTKQLMVENRLRKRLRFLGFSDYDKYVEFLFSEDGKKELEELANVLTTNKTEFFREKQHFDFLSKWVQEHDGFLNVWSAGCASGEEAYSLAIVLMERNRDFRVIGTDVSTEVLRRARAGIYTKRQIASLPAIYVNKYFDTIVDDGQLFYQVKKFLRDKVMFYKLNFMSKYYTVPLEQDIIFFRNVLIYFSLEIQNKVLHKLIRYLRRGGLLFLSHSESILNLDIPLRRIAPSVYIKI